MDCHGDGLGFKELTNALSTPGSSPSRNLKGSSSPKLLLPRLLQVLELRSSAPSVCCLATQIGYGCSWIYYSIDCLITRCNYNLNMAIAELTTTRMPSSESMTRRNF